MKLRRRVWAEVENNLQNNPDRDLQTSPISTSKTIGKMVNNT